MSQTRNATATRERILAAAEAAFAEKGYSGARVDAIAAEAGINKRMLYHYFGDKEGLYAAALAQALRRTYHHMSRTLVRSRNSDPVKALGEMIGAYFDAVQAEPNFVKLIMHEAVGGWRTLNTIDAGRDQALERVAQVIGDGVKKGRLRADLDPRLVVTLTTIVCLFYFLVIPRLQPLTSQSLNSPKQMARVRQQIIELVLHGIVAR